MAFCRIERLRKIKRIWTDDVINIPKLQDCCCRQLTIFAIYVQKRLWYFISIWFHYSNGEYKEQFNFSMRFFKNVSSCHHQFSSTFSNAAWAHQKVLYSCNWCYECVGKIIWHKSLENTLFLPLFLTIYILPYSLFICSFFFLNWNSSEVVVKLFSFLIFLNMWNSYGNC